MFRAQRPFHPLRFEQLLASGLDNVIRSKGFFWLASRMDWVGELSIVGGSTQTHAAGFWYAARHRVDNQEVGALPALIEGLLPPLTPEGWAMAQAARWSAPLPPKSMVPDEREYQAMRSLWHPLWGDRRQELAVIGIELNEPHTRAALEACLLTDEELAMGPDGWFHLTDPFVSWRA